MGSSPQKSIAQPGNSIHGISGSTALKLYYEMLRTRRVEEALMAEYHPADEMRCPTHFCVGQEAPPAGLCASLEKDDYVLTGHRSHGYYLAKGGSLDGLFAELYGKATGSNGGRAGSQELCDEEANFYSGTILSGNLAIGAGTALSSQMREDGQVTVVVLGDGGADEGIVYETLNFASLKKLPMVFICENNRYSVFSRQDTRHGLPDLAGRSRAFGVPARRLYGNDVLAVFRAARRSIDRARKGLGPSFLELDTYRWCGHVGPEDDDHLEYRPPEELNSWIEACPIKALGNTLNKLDILNKGEIQSIELKVSQEIDQAFSFAKSSPFPSTDTILNDVFAEDSTSRVGLLEEALEIPFDSDQPSAVLSPY